MAIITFPAPTKLILALQEACIRPVLLYGSETWTLRKELEGVLVGCDWRMLRYMAGIIQRDGASSEVVARRCGLKELSTVLRVWRSQWFRHVNGGGMVRH